VILETANAPGGSRSDALVIFGAAGDLAFKKLFPALQAMVKRGTSPHGRRRKLGA
jgi:glucose-6-phosphate 1-dehydrogenase